MSKGSKRIYFIQVLKSDDILKCYVTEYMLMKQHFWIAKVFLRVFETFLTRFWLPTHNSSQENMQNSSIALQWENSSICLWLIDRCRLTVHIVASLVYTNHTFKISSSQTMYKPFLSFSLCPHAFCKHPGSFMQVEVEISSYGTLGKIYYWPKSVLTSSISVSFVSLVFVCLSVPRITMNTLIDLSSHLKNSD